MLGLRDPWTIWMSVPLGLARIFLPFMLESFWAMTMLLDHRQATAGQRGILDFGRIVCEAHLEFDGDLRPEG